MSINYCFELYEFDEALTPYGTIDTKPPQKSSVLTNSFVEGNHFRTAGEDGSNNLILQLEDRLLTIVLDQSGSSSWNDSNGDRYTYLKRLLTKLDATYPGSVKANLIGFGGIPTKTTLFIAPSGEDFLSVTTNTFDNLLQQSFQDSVFDFAGVRVVRRTDRYPTHPADGIVVAEGIINAVKDEDLVAGQIYYYGIWTFNKNDLFSVGQFISGVPYDRILPQGVNFATAIPRLPPGVAKDAYTSLILNFMERSGYLTFDSSGNAKHGIIGEQTIEDNFWLGDSASTAHTNGNMLKKPVGVRFDGEFDIIEVSYESNEFDFIGSSTSILHKSITINFWIFRYESSIDRWIMGTSTDAPSDRVGIAIGVTSEGYLVIQTDDISSGLSHLLTPIDLQPIQIASKTWTMVSIVLSNDNGGFLKVYINGEIVYDDSFSNSWVTKDLSGVPFAVSFDRLYIGARPTDDNTLSQQFFGDFFGSLAQIIWHETTRNALYISDLYDQEFQIFDQSLSSSAQTFIDNFQREVLLTWEVGSDFNYSNGTVKILRKYKSVPEHANDGDEVISQTATVGQFFYLDTINFIHNGDYYYRIFTINSIGNVCDRADARIIPVHIQKSVGPVADPPLSTVSNVSLIESNQKIMLQWSNPSDSRWIGTRIFFSEMTYPTISQAAQGEIQVTNGTELVDTIKTSYVHRISNKSDSGTEIPLKNGQPYYYTIFTYDIRNRISSPVFALGTPSSEISTAFIPEEIKDLHIDILNPQTLSVQWENPTLKTADLHLYFGESALVFVSVKDIYGGNLEDITNLKLQVCTEIAERGLKTLEFSLGNNSDPPNTNNICIEGCEFSTKFEEDCNNTREAEETVLTYSTVESGLIKGLLTHTNDRQILSRREKYTMSVRAQYIVEDKTSSIPLFKFNTEPVNVAFRHPIKIALINFLNKFVDITCESQGGIKGRPACDCGTETQQVPVCGTTTYNGGYVGATNPYVCRVELQFKGSSLPSGTTVNVQAFEHGGDSPLSQKSTKTFVREGTYATIPITTEERDDNGNLTGRTVSRSYVDINILHPSESDYIDLYVTLDYLGFFVDAVHEVRFTDSLFLIANIAFPDSDGIDIAEQFAYVYTVHPDFPRDVSKRLPAPDGTLVKWELVKLKFGKERPFYSAEPLSRVVAGVYSSTRNGVARNVFFGPVGNIQNHNAILSCDGETLDCCVGEEYAIKASVILGTKSAVDGLRHTYLCKTQTFTNKRFLISPDAEQPFAGGPQSDPHWITWADGEHMVKFQIARNPALSQLNKADCFRDCIDIIGGQLIPFPDGHIVQISAPGEILWNVTFDEDPYTAVKTLKSYESVSPQINGDTGIPLVANIPIMGETTDFYIRYNAFVDNKNPAPEDCEHSTGAGGGGSGGGILPCEWKNICDGTICIGQGIKWTNVGAVNGVSTFITSNKEITLFGGGGYENGIPPIFVGFMEPLDVRIIDARVNGIRVQELLVDGISQHTFTVEVKFAGESVPDGTPIELSVTGSGQNVVILSNCQNAPDGCQPGSSGTIFTRQVNDSLINPQDDSDSVPQRSLAYFSINPLPNIAFNTRINVTCKYDKLNTINRKITKCIELNNTVNVTPPSQIPEEGTPTEQAASSDETIVYDTIQNVYESTKANKIRRMGQFGGSVTLGTGDFLYVFGGYTGQGDTQTTGITPIGEMFNTSTQTWEIISDMPTPRAFGMSTVDGYNLYCIGGIELDQLLSQYKVSRKIEVFNAISETWNSSLMPMPDDYGVAYGNAQVIGDYIYVTCGVVSITDNSKPNDLNDRILRYSIINDSWDIIIPSDEELYKRLTPFGFYRSAAAIEADKKYYIYGGSVPKPQSVIQAERNEKINRLLDEFRSFILGSAYYKGLTKEEQDAFIEDKESEIINGVIIAAFAYPSTGFRFDPNAIVETIDGLYLDISDTLDTVWSVLPKSRDGGQCVYIPHQDSTYFIGGTNQNQSTTLNRVEKIELSNDNFYTKLVSLNVGRASFLAINTMDDIYILGGLTSGHKAGWVEIDIQTFPELIEARGIQSCGFLVTLKNDSGEIIEDEVRLAIRGRLRMPAIDNILADFFANRAADRALGGDGTGSALAAGVTSQAQVTAAQNTIIDPNSDEFQFNAARKLGEQVYLFPILYSQTEATLRNGTAGFSLLPRSEDPLADFNKLSEFIQNITARTPPNPNTRFQGDLTADELAALGEILSTITLPPTIINSGSIRDLYSIETTVTILDDFYFGQTTSDFDLNVQSLINSRIEELLTPPEDTTSTPSQTPLGGVGLNGGSVVKNSPCFVLQHAAQPDIPVAATPPQASPTNPTGSGGFSQSGQCLFCQTILPLAPEIRKQLPTIVTKYYNVVDWIPQIDKYFDTNDTPLEEVINKLDVLDHEIPFGGSQLYDALFYSAKIMSGDTLDDVKKSIYIVSDNSQNLSLLTRTDAIDEVNSVDGDGKVPVIYTVFSTSFPVSLAAQLERTEVGDIEKITTATNGQSSTLMSTSFLNEILNLTIGGATGGLGYGIYTNKIEFDDLSAITAMTTNFSLPVNTAGYIRYRYSKDRFNFSDFSQRYEGSQYVNFTDFFAKILEIEVILTTGFSVDITEEYDSTATGIPRLIDILWDTSAERQDFIFLNKEDSSSQQIAGVFEGTIPSNGIVEIGVASSDSCNWADYFSAARPAMIEHGKTFLLDRTNNSALVTQEKLTSIDNILYKTTYGSWDASATVKLYTVKDGVDIPVVSGYILYPRTGEIYFHTKQLPSSAFKIEITNDSVTKVGLRLRNRLHTDSISISGVGYIYSTNDAKPIALSQVAPRAFNLAISPQTPNSADTIFALYNYIDLNNDKESGSVLSWFINGTQILEIQDKKSWSNDDLSATHTLKPGDKIYFAIKPSDGRDYGTEVLSPTVSVLAREPNADGARIIAVRNGLVNNRYDTTGDLKLDYTFATEDSGASAQESGTIIKWFVNGQLFKQGTFSQSETNSTIKTISITEFANGRSAHVIGNQVYAEVTPKTPIVTGATQTTETITIVNSIPVAKNVAIQPVTPNNQSTLQVSYSIDDQDIATSVQTDQSEIHWYSSVNGINFTEITELKNSITVSPFYLRTSHQWYVEVSPYDGLDVGVPAKSSTVTILSS